MNNGPTFTEQYEQMVAGLIKPGVEIASDLGRSKFKRETLRTTVNTFLHAGEALDAAKKIVVYGKVEAKFEQPNTLHDLDLTGLTQEQAHLLHMAIGIAGEAAEILQSVVNHLRGEPLDRENFVEEKGDMEFYLEGSRQSQRLSRRECLEHNFAKLAKRYKGHKYTDAQAIERADKKEVESRETFMMLGLCTDIVQYNDGRFCNASTEYRFKEWVESGGVLTDAERGRMNQVIERLDKESHSQDPKGTRVVFKTKTPDPHNDQFDRGIHHACE